MARAAVIVLLACLSQVWLVDAATMTFVRAKPTDGIPFIWQSAATADSADDAIIGTEAGVSKVMVGDEISVELQVHGDGVKATAMGACGVAAANGDCTKATIFLVETNAGADTLCQSSPATTPPTPGVCTNSLAKLAGQTTVETVGGLLRFKVAIDGAVDGANTVFLRVISETIYHTAADESASTVQLDLTRAVTGAFEVETGRLAVTLQPQLEYAFSGTNVAIGRTLVHLQRLDAATACEAAVTAGPVHPCYPDYDPGSGRDPQACCGYGTWTPGTPGSCTCNPLWDASGPTGSYYQRSGTYCDQVARCPATHRSKDKYTYVTAHIFGDVGSGTHPVAIAGATTVRAVDGVAEFTGLEMTRGSQGFLNIKFTAWRCPSIPGTGTVEMQGTSYPTGQVTSVDAAGEPVHAVVWGTPPQAHTCVKLQYADTWSDAITVRGPLTVVTSPAIVKSFEEASVTVRLPVPFATGVTLWGMAPTLVVVQASTERLRPTPFRNTDDRTLVVRVAPAAPRVSASTGQAMMMYELIFGFDCLPSKCTGGTGVTSGPCLVTADQTCLAYEAATSPRACPTGSVKCEDTAGDFAATTYRMQHVAGSTTPALGDTTLRVTPDPVTNDGLVTLANGAQFVNSADSPVSEWGVSPTNWEVMGSPTIGSGDPATTHLAVLRFKVKEYAERLAVMVSFPLSASVVSHRFDVYSSMVLKWYRTPAQFVDGLRIIPPAVETMEFITAGLAPVGCMDVTGAVTDAVPCLKRLRNDNVTQVSVRVKTTQLTAQAITLGLVAPVETLSGALTMTAVNGIVLFDDVAMSNTDIQISEPTIEFTSAFLETSASVMAALTTSFSRDTATLESQPLIPVGGFQSKITIQPVSHTLGSMFDLGAELQGEFESEWHCMIENNASVFNITLVPSYEFSGSEQALLVDDYGDPDVDPSELWYGPAAVHDHTHITGWSDHAGTGVAPVSPSTGELVGPFGAGTLTAEGGRVRYTGTRVSHHGSYALRIGTIDGLFGDQLSSTFAVTVPLVITVGPGVGTAAVKISSGTAFSYTVVLQRADGQPAVEDSRTRVQAMLLDAAGAVVTDANGKPAWAMPGTSTSIIGTVSAGSVTFSDLRIPSVGLGFKVRFSSASGEATVTSVESASLQQLDARVLVIEVAGQPGLEHQQIGSTAPPTTVSVKTMDSAGSPISEPTTTITATLDTSTATVPSGVANAGFDAAATLTATPSGPTAVFSNLLLSTTGAGFKFTFTSSDATVLGSPFAPVTSEPCDCNAKLDVTSYAGLDATVNQVASTRFALSAKLVDGAGTPVDITTDSFTQITASLVRRADFDAGTTTPIATADLFSYDCIDALCSGSTARGPCYTLVGSVCSEYAAGGVLGFPIQGIVLATTAVITGITLTDPPVVTAAGHTFLDGDLVKITAVAGMIELNDLFFTVMASAANVFSLSGVNALTDGYTAWTAGGAATRDPVITANGHTFIDGGQVKITGVVGTTQVNDLTFTVNAVGTNIFSLKDITGAGYTAWTSGGTAVDAGDLRVCPSGALRCEDIEGNYLSTIVTRTAIDGVVDFNLRINNLLDAATTDAGIILSGPGVQTFKTWGDTQFQATALVTQAVCGDGYVSGAETCDCGPLVALDWDIPGGRCTAVGIPHADCAAAATYVAGAPVQGGALCKSYGSMPPAAGTTTAMDYGNLKVDSAYYYPFDATWIGAKVCKPDCTIEAAATSLYCESSTSGTCTAPALPELAAKKYYCLQRPSHDHKGGSECCLIKYGDGVVCGDEVANAAGEKGEQCDDANTKNGDGCTDAGEVEPGWSCQNFKNNPGFPSACTPKCGDGIILPTQTGVARGEECDDGNTNDGDGCSETCMLETGWVCEYTDPHQLGAPVVAVITGITLADPPVVTAAGHTFLDGDLVKIAAVGGMIELNDLLFTVVASAANVFSLSGVKALTDGYTAWTAGGTATKGAGAAVTAVTIAPKIPARKCYRLDVTVQPVDLQVMAVGDQATFADFQVTWVEGYTWTVDPTTQIGSMVPNAVTDVALQGTVSVIMQGEGQSLANAAAAALLTTGTLTFAGATTTSSGGPYTLLFCHTHPTAFKGWAGYTAAGACAQSSTFNIACVGGDCLNTVGLSVNSQVASIESDYSMYSTGAYSRWLVQVADDGAPYQSTVTLSFESFHLGWNDYLYVYDGPDSNSALLVAPMTGFHFPGPERTAHSDMPDSNDKRMTGAAALDRQHLPPSIISSGRSMYIAFKMHKMQEKVDSRGDCRDCKPGFLAKVYRTYQWQKINSIDGEPPARGMQTLVAMGKTLFMFGGCCNINNDLFNLDMEYRWWTKIRKEGLITSPTGDDPPPTNRGAALVVKAVPRPRYYHTAVVIGEDMLMFGGFDNDDCMYDLWRYNNEFDQYWVQLSRGASPTSLPYQSLRRHGHTAVVSTDAAGVSTMVIFGGHSCIANLDDMWQYSPPPASFVEAEGPGGAWVQLNPTADVVETAAGRTGLPSARRYHTAVVLNGHMYVFGGVATTSFPKPSYPTSAPGARESTHPKYLDDLWAYNLAANTWRLIVARGQIPPPRSDHTAVACSLGNSGGLRMIIFGGRSTTTYNDLWQWNPAGEPGKSDDVGRWEPLSPAGGGPQNRRHGQRSACIGNVMVTVSGKEMWAYPKTPWEAWRLALRTHEEISVPYKRYSEAYLPARNIYMEDWRNGDEWELFPTQKYAPNDAEALENKFDPVDYGGSQTAATLAYKNALFDPHFPPPKDSPWDTLKADGTTMSKPPADLEEEIKGGMEWIRYDTQTP